MGWTQQHDPPPCPELPWSVWVTLGVRAGMVLGWDTGREDPAGASGGQGAVSGRCRQGCGPAGASRWLPWLTDGLLLPGGVPRAATHSPGSAFHMDLQHRCSAKEVGRWETLRFTGWDLASPLHVRVGLFPFARRGGEGLDTQKMFWGQVLTSSRALTYCPSAVCLSLKHLHGI